MSSMRVAVVGAGISGLVSAYNLAKAGVEVVLYEKENHLAKIVAINGVDIDLSFLAFHPITGHNTTELFETLGLDMETSDMSFSVSLDEGNGYEWGSLNGLSSLFSQKRNMLNPCFLKMLWELNNFKDDVLRYLEEHKQDSTCRSETLSDFIKSHNYSENFQKSYLVPICTSLWSCPAGGVMSLSAFSVFSYFHNHHLLQLLGVPQWFTTRLVSHAYIKKLKEELERRGCKIKTGCSVQSILKVDDGCLVVCEDGSQEKYSGCIIDEDAPDTLRVLGEQATYEEKKILGAFSYVNSDIFLHHDTTLMPRNQTAWSALNFVGTSDNKVCLTYWLNVLQNIDDKGLPFLVTVNPSRTPKSMLLKWSTRHPVPSVSASKASLELEKVQGKRGMWFCGAYQGYGFHEDGLKAGIVAANSMLNKSCDIIDNPKHMVPSLIENGARLFLARFLRNYIVIGTLIISEEGGKTFTFKGTRKKSSLKAYVKVHNPEFYWKIVTKADIGLADAYMSGDFSVDKEQGLLNLLMLIAVNENFRSSSARFRKRGWWTPMFLTAGLSSAKYFAHHALRKNTLTQARKNISAHYDLSNKLFSLFLDETMTYSCAIFKSEDEDLKEAQMRKISSLIMKARVEKNHEVLDIGCGWGSLAIELVKRTGCNCTGITLSEEQLRYAESKVKEAGLQEKIKFLLCDYRSLPKTCKYDRIISCEIIESVGDEYMEIFFRCCESLLAEDGIFVLQFISILESKHDEYRNSSGFMKEYIFPGSCLPSLTRITAMAASSNLCVEHVDNIGIHYYKTLRCWRENFIKNQSEILSLGFDENFLRTFEYYFDYAAAGFKTCLLEDYQAVFSRPGNVAVLGDPYKSGASAC